MGLLSRIEMMAAAAQGESNRSPERQAVLEQLKRYAREQPEFQGIVLATPKEPAQDYFVRLDSLVGAFAKVIRLPSNNALLLFSTTKDRELLNHRLTQTLRVPSLFTFPPESADTAFSLIQPYLQ